MITQRNNIRCFKYERKRLRPHLKDNFALSPFTFDCTFVFSTFSHFGIFLILFWQADGEGLIISLDFKPYICIDVLECTNYAKTITKLIISTSRRTTHLVFNILTPNMQWASSHCPCRIFPGTTSNMVKNESPHLSLFIFSIPQNKHLTLVPLCKIMYIFLWKSRYPPLKSFKSNICHNKIRNFEKS